MSASTGSWGLDDGDWYGRPLVLDELRCMLPDALRFDGLAEESPPEALRFDGLEEESPPDAALKPPVVDAPAATDLVEVSHGASALPCLNLDEEATGVGVGLIPTGPYGSALVAPEATGGYC